MDNFHISLSNEIFDSEESNFGGPAIKIEYKLDSVILFPDSTFILVTAVNDYGQSFNRFPEKPLRAFLIKDTVSNQEYMFKGKHTIAGISGMIGKYSSWKNWGEIHDSTKFIGFKTEPKEKEPGCKEVDPKKLASPFIMNDPTDNNSPFGPELVFMLGTILLLSLTGGWLTWRFYKPRLQPA